MVSSSSTARIVILGSGTSTGVPVIGCICSICQGNEVKNKRLRSSLLIQILSTEQNIVVDTTPDFRAQILRHQVRNLAGVLYTHTHADHCHGFDDLRAFFFFSKRPVEAWLSSQHLGDLRKRFAYAFEDTGYVGTKPQVILREFSELPFQVGEVEFESLPLPHGDAVSYAFRMGSFAYATDFKSFPPDALARWRGKIKTMVASGVHFRQHPTHSSIPETVALFDSLGVEKGVITHLSHLVDHQRDEAQLPEHIKLAYDGMSFDVDF